MPKNGMSGTGGVRAVERAFDLLFCLAEHPRGAGLQQLARETGGSKSTVHRLLGTLERLEVVERAGPRGDYRLAPRLRRLSRQEWAQVDLRQVARPYLQALRDECGETVTLHVVDDDTHVVVEQVESEHEVRRVQAIGQRIPLQAGATAKAILSRLSDEEVRRIVERWATEEQPGPTAEELRDIQVLGWAFSLSERVPGGAAASAPLVDASGQPVGALSVSGPAFRFTHARAARVAPSLLRAAGRVSALLGASVPAAAAAGRGR